ncbi:hypothetical protein, partial [Mycolicibacterium chitae]|uniref:hypothetical protein n=1 Tax=Mycolicibacterium chitae TaxID=1792 RepID=UPI0021F2E445
KLGRIQSEKSDHKQKTPKTGIQKNHALNGKKNAAKKQQTKTTKHTIEFSNNRLCFLFPLFGATLPA